MVERIDLSILDQPGILEIVFPVVYSPFLSQGYLPQTDITAKSYFIEVDKGIRVHCGFWVSDPKYSSLLYFHGNGETVADYEWTAPLYNQRKINLFVADYRGYGLSDGRPTIANMLSDAQSIFKGFMDILDKESFASNLFIMGRSLGSMPAIELALNYQEQIGGLIIESGAANNLRRLWNRSSGLKDILGDESSFLNKVKIRRVKKPTLIIHGEYDEIIPVEEAQELYANSGAEDKSILIIPGAGHNDIMMVEQDLYFGTIEEFVYKTHLA